MVMANRGSDENLSSSDHEDSYSTYSDDFENDSQSSRRYQSGNKRKVSPPQLESEVTSSSFVSDRSPKRYGGAVRKKKNYKSPLSTVKNTWKTSASSTASKRRPSMRNDTVQARLMSAQRNRINTLGNELGEVRVKLDQLTKENRLLRTLQHRQEKSLRQFQDTEGDLPRLISQHMEDERVLKARLRKSQEAERITEAKLKESNEEIHRMENTLRRLKKIIFDKNLGERSELAKQLAAAEDKIFESERKNKELEKKLHLTTQSYSRQLRSEQLKHKETKGELLDLQRKFNATNNKLKEKERALEVSNIYALRTKNSPEKSFIGSRLAIISHSEDKPASAPPSEAMPMMLEEPTKSVEETRSFPIAPPSHFVEAASEIKDHRKTIKTPLKITPKKASREKSDISDLGAPKTDQVISQFNDLELQQAEKRESTFLPRIEKDKGQRSVFLTSNYSPNSTFISDRAPSPKVAPPADEVKPEAPPEKVDYAAQLKAEMKLEEERKKMEDERKKKAALLAKMKDLEEEKPVSSSTPQKSDGADLRKLLETDSKTVHKPFGRLDKVDKPPKAVSTLDQLIQIAEAETRSPKRDLMRDFDAVKSYENILLDQILDEGRSDSFSVNSESPSESRCRRVSSRNYSVENLHAGVPATSNSKTNAEPDEPELTFGGYAPTVAAPPKRKPSNLLKKKKPFSPSDSESDEPLLDLDSGKAARKNEFLAQLFGTPTPKPETNGLIKKENSFASTTGTYGPKTTPRAKPIHSGYPWERDVIAAPSGHAGNGDAREKMTVSPAVKAVPSFNDEDIEEVTL